MTMTDKSAARDEKLQRMQNRAISERFAVVSIINSLSILISLIFGAITTVLIARKLGPEGSGLFTLLMSLSLTIASLVDFGIEQASALCVARGTHTPQTALGGNLLLSVFSSILATLVILFVLCILSMQQTRGITPTHVLVMLLLIFSNLTSSALRGVLLGIQSIKIFGIFSIIQSICYFPALIVVLFLFKAGVLAALLTLCGSWLVANVFAFNYIRSLIGGINFPKDCRFYREVINIGLKFVSYRIVWNINFRADLWIVSILLGNTQAGFYAIALVLSEKMKIIAQAVSMPLFSRVSRENLGYGRSVLTPLVSRTVFLVSLLCAIVLFFLSDFIITLLYSNKFSASIYPFRVLILGIVALNIATILGNDLSARGYPTYSTYVGLIILFINLLFNFLWIPRFGILGAGFATALSYTATLPLVVLLYCKISGNAWYTTILPQRGDWQVYKSVLQRLPRVSRRVA